MKRAYVLHTTKWGVLDCQGAAETADQLWLSSINYDQGKLKINRVEKHVPKFDGASGNGDQGTERDAAGAKAQTQVRAALK